MPAYKGIPAVPIDRLPQWQYELFTSLQEDLEIMMGQRGPGRAITNDAIGVVPEERQVMKLVSARGDFTTNAAVGVPTIADYTKLLNDVQQLATDVDKIQRALNALLTNLRA